MPGTITVSQQETFSTPPIAIAAGPRLKFGSTEQDVSRDGEKKWTVQAAVTYVAEYGMKPVAEIIEVTVTGGDNPAEILTPGTTVEFNRLRVGVSAPEKRDNGRVVGGKLYWMATGVRPASGKSAAAA
jgi:hypothetical protein